MITRLRRPFRGFSLPTRRSVHQFDLLVQVCGCYTICMINVLLVTGQCAWLNLNYLFFEVKPPNACPDRQHDMLG